MEEEVSSTEAAPKENLQEVFERSIQGFRKVQPPAQEYREQSLNDRKFCFVYRAQWTGKWYDQFQNKPKPEINKVLPAVLKHVNEYLNNRITADFVPDDGDENDELADVLDGLYRSDRARSLGQAAHDNGYTEAASGGYGAWVLLDCKEDDLDDEDDRQKISWKPIYDADKTVFFDGIEYDKSDSTKCWWLQPLSVDKFEEEFPGEDYANWDSGINTYGFDWITPDVVWIAYYYEVQHIDVEAIVYATPDSEEEEIYTDEDFEFDPELEGKLLYSGYSEIRRKKYKKKRVRKYIISGEKILEDCGFIAGSEIPIIPMYGMRFMIDGVEYCFGEVRPGRDPQMIINSNYAKITELSALSGIEKPIFDPKQIEGPLVDEWRNDAVENYPYLRAKTLYGPNGEVIQSGPIGYTRSPTIPQATATLLQMIAVDMNEITGGDRESEMVKSNVSGDAIELVQNKVSMQSFMPLSNMAKSVKRDAEVWLSKAKDLYVEKGRKMKTVGRTNESGTIELMKPELDDNGKLVYKNDIRKAKHKVTVEVGPSTSSKRDAVVKGIREMIQYTQDPQDIKVLTATAFQNMEGEGLQDIRDYYRMQLLKMGVGTPTEKEKEMLQPEQKGPNPQDEFLKSESAKNMARVEEIQASAQNKAADTDKKRAEALDILSQIDKEEQSQAIENTRLITNQPSETVETGG